MRKGRVASGVRKIINPMRCTQTSTNKIAQKGEEMRIHTIELKEVGKISYSIE